MDRKNSSRKESFYFPFLLRFKSDLNLKVALAAELVVIRTLLVQCSSISL